MKTKMHFLKISSLTFLILVSTFTLTFSQSGNLEVGAARIDITPADDSDMVDYEHEKLYARAIVVDNGTTKAVLVGIDAGGLGGDVFESTAPLISEELDCPVENIIMAPTHTHSSGGFGPSAPAAEGELTPTAQAIYDAVIAASENMQPANLGYGEGEAYLNVNRDVISKETRLWTQAANPNGPSDKTLGVILFTDSQGKPIAGYMNYAMHPVNAYLAGFITADFPGAATRYIENAFDDEMVMVFSQGASGDQNPLYLRAGTNVMASRSGADIKGFEMNREKTEAPLRNGDVESSNPDPEVAETLKRYIDALGVILGEEAIRVMSNLENFSDDVRIEGKREILTVPGRVRTNTGREGSPGTYEDGDPVDIQLGFLGIGDVAITTVNAEVYNIIAQQVKEASPMANTMMVTMVNGRSASGYIPDDASFGHYTFQVLGSRLQPGHAEEGIIDGLVNMVDEYVNSGTSQYTSR